MNVEAGLILFGFMACAVGGFMLGLVWCWTRYATQLRALDARAAVLDQRDELVAMRSAEVTQVTNAWARDDSGFPVKQRPSDMPPRNAGVSTKATEHAFVSAAALELVPVPAARATRESAYLTPDLAPAPVVFEPAVWGISPELARSQAGDRAAWTEIDGFYASWDTFRATLAEAFLAWILGLPEAVLTALALVFAYWPHRARVAPLNAPMAYRPAIPFQAVPITPGRTEAPLPGIGVTALLDRLRAERGEVGPRSEPPPRHGTDAADGTQAQRDREAVAAQRHAARAARAQADAHPRIFDTQEIVMPPASWGAPTTLTHSRTHSLKDAT